MFGTPYCSCDQGHYRNQDIATQQPRIPNAFSALPAQRVEKDPMLDPSMWSSGNPVRLKTMGTPEARMSATELKGFTAGDLLHFLQKAVQQEGVESAV